MQVYEAIYIVNEYRRWLAVIDLFLFIMAHWIHPLIYIPAGILATALVLSGFGLLFLGDE